jgi:diguanylate cyclase (GGDEF)-like protein
MQLASPQPDHRSAPGPQGIHGVSCGLAFSRMAISEMELKNSFNHYIPTQNLTPLLWLEQVLAKLESVLGVLRACISWVFELGISPDMPFYQKKNLALINRVSFISLLLALPGSFFLILMGFGHPFSLLVSGVITACLILGLNGAKRVEWAKILFSYAFPVIILIYTLLELSSGGLADPLSYFLARQGICFALLIPILIFGFEDRQKIVAVLGVCVLIFLLFDVGSMHWGAFQEENITGSSHGLFSVLSVLQYASLAACVLYLQSYTMQHEKQAQRSNDKLKSIAIKDGMTGSFNHTFMEQLIGDAINRSKRSNIPLALLMIDVDFFKQINDTFGHNAGDKALINVTQVLNGNKRSTDYLGRWGGDEFILLLTDTNLSGAANLAEKLRGLVDNHLFPFCKHVTISLGASVYKDGDSPASFIERADAAMYRTKRGGRNRVEVQKSSG